MKLRSTHRTGFTLIELITTMAIIAMLSAITIGAVARVRASQMQRNTDQTLSKLQGAIDQQWKALSDQVTKAKAAKQIPSALMTYCGNDLDRAAALYMYALARREFPQNFAEATSAIVIGGLTLAPRSSFTTAIGAPAGLVDPYNEAAALLYLILSENSTGGALFNADDATAGSRTNIVVRGVNCQVFRDSWGTPITYVRYAQNAELDAPPFVNSGLPAGNRDPLDPQRKLANPWANQAGAASAVAVASFDGRNKQPTVASAGPNKNYLSSASTIPYWNTAHPDGVYDGDNVVGYRLRRQGDRGY